MINTTMKRVENLLQSFPETRDNDRLLVEVYLTFYHGIKTLHEYRKTSEAPPIETITRCRRRLQALGLYLGSEDVKDERGEREAEYVRYFG